MFIVDIFFCPVTGSYACLGLAPLNSRAAKLIYNIGLHKSIVQFILRSTLYISVSHTVVLLNGNLVLDKAALYFGYSHASSINLSREVLTQILQCQNPSRFFSGNR